MSTNKQSIASSEHDDVSAAPLSSPVASLSQRTPLESLRQADEPPSEAKTTPKASQPDSLSKAAAALTPTYLGLLASYPPISASSTSSLQKN